MSDHYRIHRPAEAREFVRVLRTEGGPFYVWGTIAVVIIGRGIVWAIYAAEVIGIVLLALALTGNL